MDTLSPLIIPPDYQAVQITHDTILVARQVGGFQSVLNALRRRVHLSTVGTIIEQPHGTIIEQPHGYFTACCLTPTLIEQPFPDIQAACDFIVSQQR